MHSLWWRPPPSTYDARVRSSGALAERSQRGRKVPDLLIAAAAEERDLIVLHYDADFDLIAGVTGQRTEWVVAAGGID